MMKLGKVLVFVNLFIGVGLFAWALSLYANRLDYFDRKDVDPKVEGRFTTLQTEIKNLGDAVAVAQKAYAFKSEQARQFEKYRDDRLTALNGRLAQVRVGNAPNILFRHQVLMRDPAFPGLIDVAIEGPVVKGMRNNDLQGLGYLKSEMDKAVREETATIKRIIDARKRLEELSAKAETVQVELFKQKDIRTNLVEQKSYIADVRVNWDERLDVLQRRERQLSGKLESLGVKVVRADAK